MWGFRKGFHDREFTMPVGNLLVCEKCFFKLSEEQELRLKGLVKCEYCDNVHRMGERCPNCGAPYRTSVNLARPMSLKPMCCYFNYCTGET